MATMARGSYDLWNCTPWGFIECQNQHFWQDVASNLRVLNPCIFVVFVTAVHRLPICVTRRPQKMKSSRKSCSSSSHSSPAVRHVTGYDRSHGLTKQTLRTTKHTAIYKWSTLANCTTIYPICALTTCGPEWCLGLTNSYDWAQFVIWQCTHSSE